MVIMAETVLSKKALLEWLKEKSIDARLSMTGSLALVAGAMRSSNDTPEERERKWAEIRKMASKVKKARDILKGEGYYQVIYTVDVGEQFASRIYADKRLEVEEVDSYGLETRRTDFVRSLEEMAVDPKLTDDKFAVIKVGYEQIVDGAPTGSNEPFSGKLEIPIPELRRILGVGNVSETLK